MAAETRCKHCAVTITEWDGVWYGPPDKDNVSDPICDGALLTDNSSVLHDPADPEKGEPR